MKNKKKNTLNATHASVALQAKQPSNLAFFHFHSCFKIRAKKSVMPNAFEDEIKIFFPDQR
jgi:hypothetical protein